MTILIIATLTAFVLGVLFYLAVRDEREGEAESGNSRRHPTKPLRRERGAARRRSGEQAPAGRAADSHNNG